MDLHWVPPPQGTLKVNVHGTSFDNPLPNGNRNGIGVVLRTSGGNMINCIAGIIPNLTLIACQVWAILIGLRRAFIEGVKNVILETYNMAAFWGVQFANQNNYPQYRDLIQKILIRIRDPGWNVSFRFVYLERNRAPTYLAILGGKLFTHLYIFYEPIGALGQILDLDMGLGPHNDQFLEAPMVQEEIEVFNEALVEGWGGLAEQFMQNLGIDNGEIQLHQVAHEDELESDDDLFEIF